MAIPRDISDPESGPFTGLFAFPITPSDRQGRVDTQSLRHLLRRLTAAGFDQVGLLGSTGTYAYLSRTARGEILGATRLMVGIGALRTDDAVAHARDAQSAGADALLLWFQRASLCFR